MEKFGFWKPFEESVVESNDDSGMNSPTQTRTREEPDQRTLSGTNTVTKTREESDQDVENAQYRAIPTRMDCVTKTAVREENDQAESVKRYTAMSMNPKV